jgi:beta-glucanase (GH16 family)
VGQRIASLIFALAAAGCTGGGLASSIGVPPALERATAREPAPRLLLDQEFDGTGLDAKIWYTCYPYAKRGTGCSNNPRMELEWYRSANVSVSGGFANLTALRERAHDGYPYTSGMISTGGTPQTKATFAYRYGYAEARIKLPPGKGMWPAFWLVPANRTWPPEIDIME